MKINPKFWTAGLPKKLDWAMVLALFFTSFFFVKNAIDDYINERTIETNEGRPIKEHPSVSICFGEQDETLWNRKMYNLTEIDIIYYLGYGKNDISKILLKEGDNTSPEFEGEVITLRKMLRCYTISVKSKNYQHQKGRTRYVKVVMKSLDLSMPRETPAYFYITDQANSFGVENQKFFDGNVFTVKTYIRANLFVFTTLQPNMITIKSSQEKYNCIDDLPFWVRFEQIFVNDVQRICPNPCFPQGLPNQTLELCNDQENWRCANQVFKKMLKNDTKVNTAIPCIWLDYNGRVNTHRDIDHVAESNQV